MTFLKDLKNSGFAVGCSFYLDYYPGETTSSKIVLSVQVNNTGLLTAIVDTGAPWSIFDPELLAFLGINTIHGYYPQEGLIIRGEKYHGMLVRIPITLIADEGEDLTIETTVFVPDADSWHYPNFLGLEGCLSRIRFAIDPSENVFYFGTL